MEKIKYILLTLLMPAMAFASNPPFHDQPLHHNLFDRNILEYYSGEAVKFYAGNNTRFVNTENRKSPLLAGVLSAAVPGVGEMYSGNLWRGIIHLGIEAATWGFYFYFNNEGDVQTDRYMRFANQHWSVVRYAEWLNHYWLDEIPEDRRPNPIQIDPDASKSPWERVNWNQIHSIENEISRFSHKLDPYGTQQYYEMIGKYAQFNRGWDDSIPADDFDIERTIYIDDISERFLYYSGKRGYANTLYSRAHNAAMVVFLNHFISAFHAAYLAHRFNQTHFAVDVENRHDLYGERYVPTVRLKVGF